MMSVSFTRNKAEPNAYLHLVHDGGSNDEPAFIIRKRMPSSRNWHTVLGCIHVSIDDMIFTAN